MPRNKCETLSIRTTAEIKDLIRRAAESDHRSVASMIEILILDYANEHLPASPLISPRERKTSRKTKIESTASFGAAKTTARRQGSGRTNKDKRQ